MSSIFQFDIEVTAQDVDRNGHVNNVVYIQWMQDAAIAHARTSGCTKASQEVGATWVVRTHHIEYLMPAFAGEKITVLTWPANFQRVRSLRKYKFVRANDQAVIARAETDWVFINAKTGRPQSIPDTVRNTLPIVPKELEPR
jgi:acyl-CoA thioester hydrolase